jgi:PncC family amidohydrolase
MDEELERLARRVGEALGRRSWTVGTAESCTGGLVGHAITEIAGSSAYYLGGIIAYDNAVKQGLLKVPAITLREHGAVSGQTAIAMAEGARAVLRTSVGVATTGIAGPGGGSAEKPVGLVHIAVITPAGRRVERHVFGSDRGGNKLLAARRALALLAELLKDEIVI